MKISTQEAAQMGESTHPITHPLWMAIERAEAAIEAADTEDALDEDALEVARMATHGTDCPRPWEIHENGTHYTSILATSIGEALEIARDAIDRRLYGSDGDTIWVDLYVLCPWTREDEIETVMLEPDAPECVEHYVHDWREDANFLASPISHGGGVLIRECCARCGTYRTIDTWTQRPDTGEVVGTTTRYATPDEYSSAWIASIVE